MSSAPPGKFWVRALEQTTDNTQHSQKTDIQASDGIQNRSPNKRVAADPHLRPRGQWDWH